MLQELKNKLQRELLDIENRADLRTDEKASRVINIFAITCAATAVQPIPFADYFILTPMQAWMGERLSAIHGMPLSGKGAADLLKEIGAVCGFGLAGQQFVLGCYKTFVPFLGGVTTFPLVYGSTYAIGRAMDAILAAKARNQPLSGAELRKLWGKWSTEGKNRRKQNAPR